MSNETKELAGQYFSKTELALSELIESQLNAVGMEGIARSGNVEAEAHSVYVVSHDAAGIPNGRSLRNPSRTKSESCS